MAHPEQYEQDKADVEAGRKTWAELADEVFKRAKEQEEAARRAPRAPVTGALQMVAEIFKS